MINEQPAEQETRPKPPEPSNSRLQVLATEHWSLLATRSLTYMESFSRVSMYLSALTGAVVALALFAQVDHFHETFVMVAILMLFVVVFVGLATIGRLHTLNLENYQWVAGMNRLRHAYLELYPDLEPYFVAGSHDDVTGFGVTMSLTALAAPSPLANVAQGFQSLPTMLAVINGTVAGLLGGLVASRIGASTVLVVVVAIVVFVLTNVLTALLLTRSFFRFIRRVPARFPSPPKADMASG